MAIPNVRTEVLNIWKAEPLLSRTSGALIAGAASGPGRGMGRERKLLRARFASAFHSARFPAPRLVASAPPRPPSSRLPLRDQAGPDPSGLRSSSQPSCRCQPWAPGSLVLFSTGVPASNLVLVTSLLPSRLQAGRGEPPQKRSPGAGGTTHMPTC
ncbi:hypothetical protein P7K49_024286 [Saguinus oedipus]|uniref:Uncharacterized protein n=1 Tax=Saguinus oedipus TaxID=9490 RepID=A0ABQ9UPX2_SAGOE|nr:hypothetical protein P7K49_024286 [Saguinus oedipus]